MYQFFLIYVFFLTTHILFMLSCHYKYNYFSLGVDLVQDIQYRQYGYIGAMGMALAVEITPKLAFGSTLNLWTDNLFWENGWNESYSEYSTGTSGGGAFIGTGW